MKNLLLGILVIILVGVGGLIYRNAAEHPYQRIACPLDAEVCPDGTTLSRTGVSCSFPACPPPNVSLTDLGIAYAVPAGFAAEAVPDASVSAAYAATTTASSTVPSAEILIRAYAREGTTTPLAVIESTAVGNPSGQLVPPSAFTSTTVGTHQFTIVPIERFEGTVDTAYYLSFGSRVLRFDAVDRGVDWTNPGLDRASLPAATALKQLLLTLQGASS